VIQIATLHDEVFKDARFQLVKDIARRVIFV